MIPEKLMNFKGLKVGLDKVDMPKENSPDLSNVETFTKGQLNNIPGMEKQESSGLTGSMTAINELDGDVFVLVGETLQVL